MKRYLFILSLIASGCSLNPSLHQEEPQQTAPANNAQSIPTQLDSGIPHIIEFALNSADLSGKALETINTHAEHMISNPNKLARVTGSASTVGEQTSNYKLALRRARKVKKQLVYLGVDPRQIAISSRGEFQSQFDKTRIATITY